MFLFDSRVGIIALDHGQSRAGRVIRFYAGFIFSFDQEAKVVSVLRVQRGGDQFFLGLLIPGGHVKGVGGSHFRLSAGICPLKKNLHAVF